MGVEPGHKRILRHLAGGLSGLAVVFLSVAGAWYFGAALWWLQKHYWPAWDWMAAFGWGRGAAPWLQFLATRSPGGTALIAAGLFAVLARVVDPTRRRR
jgi:hypothetical protein